MWPLAPLALRPPDQVQFRTPVFLLPAGLDPAQPLYVRLQSSISLSMPVRLWSGRGFMGHAFRDSLALRTVFGILVAMMLFNLLIFSYPFAMGPLSATSFTCSPYSWPNSPRSVTWRPLWSFPPRAYLRTQTFFMACSIFFAVLFTRVFLNNRQNVPSWDKFLNNFLPLRRHEWNWCSSGVMLQRSTWPS
ncbi:hypothetical protein DFAR_2310009 [Desulfarculales bacterium]